MKTLATWPAYLPRLGSETPRGQRRLWGLGSELVVDEVLAVETECDAAAVETDLLVLPHPAATNAIADASTARLI